jgi:hypothetical protein
MGQPRVGLALFDVCRASPGWGWPVGRCQAE